MLFRLLTILSFFVMPCYIRGQDKDTSKTIELEEVNIKAFQYNGKLKDLPAPVNYVSQHNLETFGRSSVVSAVNITPGVKMEERSPGSYRMNIRGSILRSPFGVRNVKVYFNDIPITDPGGHTYLNQLGNYNFQSIEIIKGPGSSLYGAGTSGVLLINSLARNEPRGITTEYSTGSFSYHNLYGGWVSGKKDNTSKLTLQYQCSDGYRRHAASKRFVTAWTGDFKTGAKSRMRTTILYGDLYYETPGALTLKEFEADPRAARPAGGGLPSAEVAKAAISQKGLLGGLSFDQEISASITNSLVVYGMFTDFSNPTIRNYSASKEPHVGGRTIFTMKKGAFIFSAGAEIQQNFTRVKTYSNKNGNADSLQLDDKIHTGHNFTFIQLRATMGKFEVLAGLSQNQSTIKYTRNIPVQPAFRQKFNIESAPRLALSWKLKDLNIYSSISKGFSPPSSNELLPSGNNFNHDLNAEHGLNYDAGLKGKIFKQLSFDINAFIFSLKNTIVQRRDASGADYYINAGSTKQHGVETSLTHPLFVSNKKISYSLAWISHTWHDFHYKDFKQLNNDFSGKQLPAVAPHIISTGFDITLLNGLLGSVSFYHSDKVPLNDANTEYARPYDLLNARLGYEWKMKKASLRIIAGADNLLDETYSLGNDINAFGGRYYNAAPVRNYFITAGLVF